MWSHDFSLVCSLPFIINVKLLLLASLLDIHYDLYSLQLDQHVVTTIVIIHLVTSFMLIDANCVADQSHH